MAGLPNDIIRLTDRQRYVEQTVLNVYFYQINPLAVLAGDYLTVIGEWFRDNVLVDVIPFQMNILTHTELYLENLSNGLDIETITDEFPITGNIDDSQGMPPYASLGFQLIRESRATRNGYKRIGGIAESVQEDGVIVPGLSSLVTTLEDSLAADVVVGVATIAAPVILKHPFTVPLVDPIVSNIGSAQYRSVGTQNTRKIGRGS